MTGRWRCGRCGHDIAHHGLYRDPVCVGNIADDDLPDCECQAFVDGSQAPAPQEGAVRASAGRSAANPAVSGGDLDAT
uniref:Uncharacterized protein n=1 Tax=Mycobacterium sp. (strain KMS) TaxID=189918 RepID=A1UJS2_MYCSK